ncbi:hypothetical protein E2C01_071203 [Portunus trituberculatus]|uniref:Uncharacterized protein n=1 Tax=Portunus trituberculatus TaxID=210409 RepID=A0A5B7HUS0_PORTR|nr:hypothetical protein [Portunus trituberculatus]
MAAVLNAGLLKRTLRPLSPGRYAVVIMSSPCDKETQCNIRAPATTVAGLAASSSIKDFLSLCAVHRRKTSK